MYNAHYIISNISYQRLTDDDFPRATYTMTFNIMVSDVDDVTPAFINLPSNSTITRGLKAGLV